MDENKKKTFHEFLEKKRIDYMDKGAESYRESGLFEGDNEWLLPFYIAGFVGFHLIKTKEDIRISTKRLEEFMDIIFDGAKKEILNEVTKIYKQETK